MIRDYKQIYFKSKIKDIYKHMCTQKKKTNFVLFISEVGELQHISSVILP